ncbi:MAG: hypothetical protein DWQ37_10560 [Planctomycetota bacterium]|nr:MAG: hypothetical protein DWQ37_10560 [Planctomycetota bacterium]
MYRAVRRTRAKKILEIGLASTDRTLRMIRLASSYAEPAEVQYAAIDLFESRPSTSAQQISLKQAHRLLKQTPAKAQLIPGDASSALQRAANALPNIDLLLISSDHDEAAMQNAWFYVPRMLHARSVVYWETVDAETGESTFRLLTLGEIQTRATAGRRRRAA